MEKNEPKVKRRPGRPWGNKQDNANKAKDFAWKLRRERARRGLSQTQMGKLMQIKGRVVPSKIAMAKWEAGLHAPQKRYLDRLNQLMAEEVK